MRLVEELAPTDALGATDREQALAWLRSTDDVFRRARPRTPSPHLVSAFVLVDREQGRLLLCHHRLAGMWLPTGGHVEPGEHPLATVRREVVEELGVPYAPDPVLGEAPFLLAMAATVGAPETRHVDATLWYALEGRVGQPLTPDDREFHRVAWWSAEELTRAGDVPVDPHLSRAVDALGLCRGSAELF